MEVLIHYQGVDVHRNENKVLSNVELEIKKGEFAYLIGKVGTGKSSLLKTMYGEVPVKTGIAKVLGYDLTKIKKKELPFLRRKVGIVFQDFQLLTDRSVFGNLEFVLKATGWKRATDIKQRIGEVLAEVGLAHKESMMPHQLSGGEQQRVVIARAMLNAPEVILADEPTGNLDVETGKQIVTLLHNICKSGTSVIMCTHNLTLIETFPGTVLLCKQGGLQTIIPNKEQEPIFIEPQTKEEPMAATDLEISDLEIRIDEPKEQPKPMVQETEEINEINIENENENSNTH